MRIPFKHINRKISSKHPTILFLSLVFIVVTTNSTGQGLIISPGTNFTGTGGTIEVYGNITTNGSFINNNTVIFSGGFQVIGGDSSSQFKNLTVSAGTIVSMVTGGQTLSGILISNGTLNSDDNLTLLSTESATALIDGKGTGQVLGALTMQRYLNSGFGYKYLSSPFSDASVSELGDDMDLEEWFPTLYRYNENRTTSGWVSHTNPEGPLIPMYGYAVNMGESSEPKTIDIKGNVNNGEHTLTLFNHNHLYTKGFNLMGNPYPSPIDWYALSGWTKINIDDALYYFMASTTDRYGGTYSTYMDGISSDGLATSIIPSMQGFFVHVSDGSYPVAGTLGTTNEVRITDLEQPLIKSDNKSDKSYIRLVAGYSDDPISFDPLVIYFDIKATSNFDGQLDALKLYNTDLMVTNFYSFGDDGSRLSINSLPIIDENPQTVRLGLKTERDGEVIFNIRDIVGDFYYKEISLTDLVTGIEQELLLGKQYQVSLPAGHYQERFYLNLSNTPTSITDPYDNKDKINIYSSQKTLFVRINIPSLKDGWLSVFNLSGQVLYKYKINGPGDYQFNPLLSEGLYIISFNSGSMKTTKKLYFQH
jgi:hypothetical protein